jgi:hypothetical protein
MGSSVDSLARRSKESHSRPTVPTLYESTIVPDASSCRTVVVGNPS